MSVVSFVSSWWEARRARRLQQLLAVEFDDAEVRIRVIEHMKPEWNQSFRWSSVRRICVKDEGMWASDNLFVELNDREHAVIIPVEARGGSEFLNALHARGLLPEPVWRKALGDSSGGIHCWPPHERKAR